MLHPPPLLQILPLRCLLPRALWLPIWFRPSVLQPPPLLQRANLPSRSLSQSPPLLPSRALSLQCRPSQPHSTGSLPQSTGSLPRHRKRPHSLQLRLPQDLLSQHLPWVPRRRQRLVLPRLPRPDAFLS
ncbi:hypothetical protein T484DRAFT_1946222 [Baffinella frigidus]|nr:hypothetical protein T484DRAFT_1946222 [Cryptophyta sp. CCMP2293]